MGKRNKAITAALIGSIVALAVVVSYAVINNRDSKERSEQVVQQEASNESNSITGSPEEILFEELVYGEAEGEYSEQQISVPVIQALAGNSGVDCSIQTMDIVSFSQSAEGNNELEGVIVTPDTFGSDDSIYVVCIGYDVTHIEDGSFSNLRNLKEIRVDSRNPYYTSVNGCLYTKDLSTLVCIPQNTSSVQVITSITGYTPHALDGLEQSRIDKLNSVLDGSYFAKQDETYPTTQKMERYASVDKGIQSPENYRQREGNEFSGSSITEGEQDNNTQPYANNNEVIGDNDVAMPNDEYPDESNVDIEVVDISDEDNHIEPSRSSSTDFTQYVYWDEKGRKCFKYTGTGDTRIIIPEGVEKIAGFTASTLEWNDTVTYVYIPASVQTMSMYVLFDDDGDDNWYNCLYQCRNLQTVECGYTDEFAFRSNGNSVYQPGDIYVWSSNSRIPYDEDAYRNATW